MPTTIIKTVKPSGGDYTSLAAAEAGEQRDLTAVDQIAQIDCYAMTDTTAVTIAGWTTDATRYVHVNVPASERHNGRRSPTKYRLEAEQSFSAALNLNVAYCRLEGFAVKNTQTSGNGMGVSMNPGTGTSEIRISDSIVYDCAFASAAITTSNCGLVETVNCVVMDCGNGTGYSGNGDAFEMQANGSTNWHAYNCVAVNCKGRGFYAGSFRSMTCKNCYAGGCGTGFFDAQGSGDLHLASCFSSDGSFGTTTVPFSTANFTNITAGTEDLSLPAGSALIDAGTDLSTDPNWVDPAGFVDIIGTARPQGAGWDVGAFEYVPSSGGAVSLIFDTRRIQRNSLLRR